MSIDKTHDSQTMVKDKVLAVALESTSNKCNVIKVRYIDNASGDCLGRTQVLLSGREVFVKVTMGVKEGDLLRVILGDKIDSRLGKLTNVVLGTECL